MRFTINDSTSVTHLDELALLESEQLAHVEPSVHARHDRDLLRWG
jgi:hypothetical protein